MAVTLEATNGNRSLRATGRTRAEAQRRLIEKIAVATGSILKYADGTGAYFVPLFADQPHGPATACHIDAEGNIVCPPACECAKCTHHQHAPKEKRFMARRFDESREGMDGTDADNLRNDLRKFISSADDDVLTDIAAALLQYGFQGAPEPLDDGKFDDGAVDPTAEEKKLMFYCENFRDKLPRNTPPHAVLRGFRAAHKRQPGLTAEAFLRG